MILSLAGVILAFALILFLAAKGVQLGLALLIGACVAGLLLPLTLGGFFRAVGSEVFSSATIQLIIAVSLISGLGKVMKQSGDLDLIVRSLSSILRSDQLLCMIIPALFGALNVPGGAIMSAPLVEESAAGLGLPRARLSAINIFFRHIPNSVYPLYPSIIVTSELLSLDRLAIIRSNALSMVVGLAVAYLVYFGRVKVKKRAKTDGERIGSSVGQLALGFSPIIVMLAVVVVFDLPFYLAAALGVALALAKGLVPGNFLRDWLRQAKRLFSEWIDYKVALTMVGIMAFKGVIQDSGVIDTTLSLIVENGVSLPLLVVGVGLTVSYALGVHQAATGLLVPILGLLFPQEAFGSYLSLLFFSLVVGYVLSPLHLCLTLSNHYYKVALWDVYKELFVPMLALLGAALLCVYL